MKEKETLKLMTIHLRRDSTKSTSAGIIFYHEGHEENERFSLFPHTLKILETEPKRSEDF